MHKFLYKAARKMNKAASILNDISVLKTGDPKKIAKRYARKSAYKASHGGASKVARMISKLFK